MQHRGRSRRALARSASRADTIGGSIGHASSSDGSFQAEREVGARFVGSRVQVADVGLVGHDLEAVRDERRQVEVVMIDVVENESLDTTERRRPRPSVDHEIDDRATRTTHQLGLACSGPDMQSTEHRTTRARLVVMDEVGVESGFPAPVEVQGPREPAALVVDGPRCHHEHAVDRRGSHRAVGMVYDFHTFHGGCPLSHSELSNSLSRVVSMHCQNPSWPKPLSWPAAASPSRGSRAKSTSPGM